MMILEALNHEDRCIDAHTRVVNAPTRDETCARNFKRKITIFFYTIYLILLHRIGTPAVGEQ